jgi:hypothetical protein
MIIEKGVERQFICKLGYCSNFNRAKMKKPTQSWFLKNRYSGDPYLLNGRNE